MRLFLVLWLVCLAAQVETVLVPPREDSALWLYMAGRMERGEMPGRDLWDNKLPPIYLIGRAALATGHPRMALWLWEAALTAAGACAIARLLRATGVDTTAAGAAAGLLCVVSGLPNLHAGGYMTEVYAMPLTALAALASLESGRCARSAGQNRALGLGMAAGGLWLLAVALRLPLAPAALLTATGLSWAGALSIVKARSETVEPSAAGGMSTTKGRPALASPPASASLSAGSTPSPLKGEGRGEGPKPSSLARGETAATFNPVKSASDNTAVDNTSIPAAPRGVSIFGLWIAHTFGATLAVALVFAHPWKAGYLPECLSAAIAWPLNLGAARIPGPLTPTNAERLLDFSQDLLKTGWLFLAALAGVFLAFRSPAVAGPDTAGPVARSPRGVVVVALLWLFAAVASALLGWASYGHYLYVALAPAALGWAWFVHAMRPDLRRPVAAALLVVSLVVTAGWNATEIVKRRQDPDAADRAAIVAAIQRQVPRREAVFPWIAGRHHDLLLAVDRPIGSHHPVAASYFRMDLRLFDAFASEFLAAPPAWILEDLNLRRPSIRDPGRFEWEATLPNLFRVQMAVRRDYIKAARCGRFVLWRLDVVNRGPEPPLGEGTPR